MKIKPKKASVNLVVRLLLLKMKRVESAGDMAAHLNEQIKIKHIDHFFAEKAGSLSTLMSGTHGRDKMCALIQYMFMLYN